MKNIGSVPNIGSTERPKVFISYSWTNVQHEQWVLNLSERLSGDGIYVVLDKWDLKEGQDKHAFMEQMVNDKTINKVLVVCDKGYQMKADNREGGVGTETQLISKEVYENTGQEKFIPIAKEYDEQGKPCIPHFMANRIYVDLSSDEVFEENYQKLIRNLYNRPLLKRPPLGTPPAYIIEGEQVVLKTSHKVSEIKNAILNDRKSSNGLISDYFDTFLTSLEDFRLQGSSAPNFDDRVLESIERMLTLRNDFIDFTFTVFKYQEHVDLGKCHSFLEKLISFGFPPENVQRFTDVDFDNYKFFIYELVLYFIAILLQLKKYNEASFFIHSQYFYRSYYSGPLEHSGIEVFNEHVRFLDEIRNKRLNLRRVSVTADLLKSRGVRKDISFNQIIQTDLVIHYIVELRRNGVGWFPRTSVCSPLNLRIELFERMISTQEFEKIKNLFDVKDIDELKKLVSKYVECNKGRPVYFDWRISPLKDVIDPNKIGTVE